MGERGLSRLFNGFNLLFNKCSMLIKCVKIVICWGEMNLTQYSMKAIT